MSLPPAHHSVLQTSLQNSQQIQFCLALDAGPRPSSCLPRNRPSNNTDDVQLDFHYLSEQGFMAQYDGRFECINSPPSYPPTFLRLYYSVRECRLLPFCRGLFPDGFRLQLPICLPFLIAKP